MESYLVKKMETSLYKDPAKADRFHFLTARIRWIPTKVVGKAL